MKNILNVFVVSLLVNFGCLCIANAQVPSATIIKLGEQAPDFKYSYWIKGEPVKKYEKGKVYVIEFWATWCVYCIKAMPHLSELNTMYAGKVKFIGVDVAEVTPYGSDPVSHNKAKVAKFISEGKGKEMNYDICVDTKDGYYWMNWVTGQSLFGPPSQGIPFTVVVDKKGNTAWIGHPMELDSVLAEVVNDTYDVQKFIAQCNTKRTAYEVAQKKAEADREALRKSPALAPMFKAADEKKYQVALNEAYTAISSERKLTGITFLPRLEYFMALLPANEDEFFSSVELERNRMVVANDTLQNFIKSLSARIGTTKGLSKKTYDFAIDILKKEPSERVITSRLLNGLSHAYYNAGNRDMAITVMEGLIKRIKEITSSNPNEYEIALATFKEN